MTTDGSITPDMPRSTVSRIPSWGPLALGLLTLLIATVVNLGRETWATEAGAHGPIVLATGGWLLFHNRIKLDPPRGRWRGPASLLLLALPAYAFGRAFDFISIEGAGLYLTMIAIAWRLAGQEELRRNAFPLIYLGFIVPPPGWLIDRITAPLQTLVSRVAETVTAALDYPVARHGVALDVGPYQLLVEDACAGMNSIVGLTAVSLLYIYLMRGASLRYAMVLVLLIVPVAVLVNIIRVIALILITYHFGDAAAQGFLHATTGIILFGAAVLIIFAVDWLLWRLWPSPR